MRRPTGVRQEFRLAVVGDPILLPISDVANRQLIATVGSDNDHVLFGCDMNYNSWIYKLDNANAFAGPSLIYGTETVATFAAPYVRNNSPNGELSIGVFVLQAEGKRAGDGGPRRKGDDLAADEDE